MVCPRDEQRRVVLPVKATLEEVCARAVFGSVDVGDAGLRGRVVDLDTQVVRPCN